MKLVIASNNQNKVKEIKEILGDHFSEICSLKDEGIYIEVAEDADTFQGNARKKAEEVLKICDADAALSDDSGLVVDALDGAPGVYSARFAGEQQDDEANNNKLLKLMEAVPQSRRTCRFVSAVALARKGMPTLIRTGECEGQLLKARRGTNGFGYDPLFYYVPKSKSFAELTAKEKNEVSHRRIALDELEKALREEKE